ncbi:MAG: molybdenum cofactor guanylyltransferase [Oscillospiraceae bacterium]|jgi:molybdopterin-guanine dinucleotide biosynthesis protein A|nr:molybdenum cofactor guanylyltransferase [Oscillospiraceae bacterium]
MMVYAILAGGKSTRMGRDKLTLTMSDGVTLTQDALRRFGGERVVLSVNDAGRFSELPVERVADEHREIGPLGGLHAVLRALECDAFLVAADMPFATLAAANRVAELSLGFDAGAIISDGGRAEPLFAYYSLRVLPLVESMIAEGVYKMGALLRRVNLREIRREELGSLWFDSLLYNVNYPSDYAGIAGMDAPRNGEG